MNVVNDTLIVAHAKQHRRNASNIKRKKRRGREQEKKTC